MIRFKLEIENKITDESTHISLSGSKEDMKKELSKLLTEYKERDNKDKDENYYDGILEWSIQGNDINFSDAEFLGSTLINKFFLHQYNT